MSSQVWPYLYLTKEEANISDLYGFKLFIKFERARKVYEHLKLPFMSIGLIVKPLIPSHIQSCCTNFRNMESAENLLQDVVVDNQRSQAATVLSGVPQGNILCFYTLLRGKALRIPHFLYYRMMTAAELLYCATFCISLMMEYFTTRRNGYPPQLEYITYSSAYFQCCVARLIYSSTGYTALYMSLIIAADRFAAVQLRASYQRLSNRCKRRIALRAIVISALLSCGVHSWYAIYERSVLSKLKHFSHDPYYNQSTPPDPSRPPLVIPQNGSLVPTVYICERRTWNASDIHALRTLKIIKDYLNLTVRVSYPILLLLLTLFVINSWFKFVNRRRALFNKPTCAAQLNQLRGCAGTSNNHNNGNSSRIRSRREVSLFYLMMAVVLLAFVQVIPRELRRLLNLTTQYATSDVYNSHDVRFADRIHIMDVVYYNRCLILASNIATWIDRCLKFYFYVALNPHFRNTFLTVIAIRGSLLHRQETISQSAEGRSCVIEQRATPANTEAL